VGWRFEGSFYGKGRAGLEGSIPGFRPRYESQLPTLNTEYVTECRNCRVSAMAGPAIYSQYRVLYMRDVYLERHHLLLQHRYYSRDGIERINSLDS
jgi:hypothetical protein